MSQITVKSLVNMRGRAYRCRLCPVVNPLVGEKSRVESHIYKNHVPLEKVPYYCKLCTFRCTKQEDLENHVLTFRMHRVRARPDVPDETWLVQSDDPYILGPNDMEQLSVADSEVVWRSRSRATAGEASATITSNSTFPTSDLNLQAYVPRQFTPLPDPSTDILRQVLGTPPYIPSTEFAATPGLQTISTTALSSPTPPAASILSFSPITPARQVVQTPPSTVTPASTGLATPQLIQRHLTFSPVTPRLSSTATYLPSMPSVTFSSANTLPAFPSLISSLGTTVANTFGLSTSTSSTVASPPPHPPVSVTSRSAVSPSPSTSVYVPSTSPVKTNTTPAYQPTPIQKTTDNTQIIQALNNLTSAINDHNSNLQTILTNQHQMFQALINLLNDRRHDNPDDRRNDDRGHDNPDDRRN
ncbi:MAG: hypothetical protein ABW185_20550, partial [Sedimenticola sp.]